MATKTRTLRVGDQAIWNYCTDYSIEPYRVAVRIIALEPRRILVEPLMGPVLPSSLDEPGRRHWVSWRAVEPIDERER